MMMLEKESYQTSASKENKIAKTLQPILGIHQVRVMHTMAPLRNEESKFKLLNRMIKVKYE